MNTRWILLISLFVLALGSCRPSQTAVEFSSNLTPQDTDIVSSVTADLTATKAPRGTTADITSTVIAIDAWKNYHNLQAGFSTDYPADWTVNESAGINGELITSFVAPNDGQGITVIVRNGEPADQEIPDMPNTRCQQVTISGFPGRRCFDTVASNISTTFLSHGTQYSIATFGKNLDQDIYQSFLEGFTLTP